MSTKAQVSYDAIIVGGGPAGASAAILLAQAGWQIALVEKKPFPRRKVCGEFISASSWPLLRAMGVAGSLLAQAGPEIRRVGLYSGETILAADMPPLQDGIEVWGRALGREHLDTALVARATQVGAEVWQPWTFTRMERTAGGHVCTIVTNSRTEGAEHSTSKDLLARIVIVARGSWDPGPVQFESLQYPRLASDLFAFKAHFLNGSLPSQLMPLLMFPGGYGGMVQTDCGRVSVSCCIRRDALARCRSEWGSAKERARAGEAVFAHIRASCLGVRLALSGALLDGAWLSAGPIRPGIRTLGCQGIYMVGNASGEAHPIVAEGISMAVQSAWLLCEHLVARKDAPLGKYDSEDLGIVERAYTRSWRENFVARIHAAALLAHMSMRPATAKLIVAVLQRAPAMLTFGARWSGKVQPLRGVRDVETT